MKPIACASCHRHSNLISHVYPTTPGEEGPKSAALSLLVFYATSKPQKLPKIGAFLEAKVEKDVVNSRFSMVAVTLTIITTLLRDCKQNVSLFSKSVLRIILRVLNCSEQNLIEMAIETFVLFTESRNPEDALDVEFSLVHNDIVLKLCRQAIKEHTGGDKLKMKWRYNALNALLSLCKFNYFVDGSKIDGATDKVLESILKNIEYIEREDSVIKSATDDIPTMNPTQITEKGVVSRSENDQILTKKDLSNIAVKCLTEIIRNSNALTLKMLLYSVFRILDANNQLEDGYPALFLLPIFVSSSETQYHFVIITLILDKIRSESRIPIKTTLAKSIRYLILAEKLTGLTIPELLEEFVYHLSESTKLSAPVGTKESNELTAMQVAFTKSIASLSVHLAYPNQINEIISFLVNRAQFDGKITKLTPSQEKYLVYILKSLTEVLQVQDSTPKTASRMRNSFVPGSIGYNLLIPIMIYFESNSIDVRLELFRALNAALNSGRVSRRQASFEEFFKFLLSAISLYGSNQDNKPADYVGMGLLMCNMVSVNSPDSLGSLIPVIFHLQHQCSKYHEDQQMILGTVMVEFLLWAGSYLNATKFVKYMENIKQNKIKLNEWSPNLDLNDGSLDILRSLSFNNVEANTKPKGYSSLLDETEIKDTLFNSLMEIKEEAAVKVKSEWEKGIIKEDFNFEDQTPSDMDLTKSIEASGQDSKNSLKSSSSKKYVAIKLENSSDKPELKPAAANSLSSNSILEKSEKLESVPELDEQKTFSSNETTSAIMDILKVIADAYGSPPADRRSMVSREHSADVAGKLDHELDFLRSRTKSNMNQSPSFRAPSPEKAATTRSLSPHRTKLREPAIFGMQE